MRLEKTQGHWRVRSLAFPGETNVFTFALHLYRFLHGQSYFSFSKKSLWVQNGVQNEVQNGVRNRVQIRGPKGGSTFCYYPLFNVLLTNKHCSVHLFYIADRSSTIDYLRPYFPKMTSQLSWLLIGGEDLRKIFGKLFGKWRLLIGC